MVFATVVLLISSLFSGCKRKENKKENNYISVGYVTTGAESSWRIANTESFKSTFTNENGYTLHFVEADQKQENQIAAMREFIQEKVDFIVVAPVVENGWEVVLCEAKEAGIPVILSDRMMKVTDDSLYLCWVGGNFVKEGQDGVKWLEAYLKEQGRENEEIKIIDLQGTMGASPQIGRTQGLEEGVLRHPNWKIISQQTGDFTESKAERVMESLLEQFDEIDVVYAENDNMAWGAISAIKAKGLVPGKDIIIICFDAVMESFKRMIATGEINCAVECNPLHGPRVDKIIRTVLAGESVDKVQYVTEEVFDVNGIGGAIRAEEALPSRTY